jgi:hypothetical protein
MFRYLPAAPLHNSMELQHEVARLADTEPHQCKCLLGSPAGPELTPPLRSTNKVKREKAYKSMFSAWSSLKTDQVIHVFVTQHNPAAVAVHEMVSPHSEDYAAAYYNLLPDKLRCNAAVALAALDLVSQSSIRLPSKLNTNTFALAAIRRVGIVSPDKSVLKHFEPTVLNDEDVVLAAIANNPKELLYAPRELKASKSFLLKAVGVHGTCIQWAAPALKKDKDVALAAVRQNKAAIHHLWAELQEDKDIVEACTNNE